MPVMSSRVSLFELTIASTCNAHRSPSHSTTCKGPEKCYCHIQVSELLPRDSMPNYFFLQNSNLNTNAIPRVHERQIKLALALRSSLKGNFDGFSKGSRSSELPI
jgi:hypothetical protein